VVEQVGQPLLAPRGQHRLEDFPHLAALGLIFRERLPWFSRLRQGDLFGTGVGAQRIHDGSMQAGAQVPQGGSQGLEFDLLGYGGRLPEALEGQRDVVCFTLQAAGGRPARMAAQPGDYNVTEAALHPFPGLRIFLERRAVEEFQPIGLVARLAPAISFQLQQAPFPKRGIAQRAACPCSPHDNKVGLFRSVSLDPLTYVIGYT